MSTGMESRALVLVRPTKRRFSTYNANIIFTNKKISTHSGRDIFHSWRGFGVVAARWHVVRGLKFGQGYFSLYCGFWEAYARIALLVLTWRGAVWRGAWREGRMSHINNLLNHRQRTDHHPPSLLASLLRGGILSSHSMCHTHAPPIVAVVIGGHVDGTSNSTEQCHPAEGKRADGLFFGRFGRLLGRADSFYRHSL